MDHLPILKRRLELLKELDSLDYVLDIEEEEWNIYSIACSGCGATRWSKGVVGNKKTIVKCDLCPLNNEIH